jgi:1-aminocyclopropane-1-carboxylate synthase
VSTVYHRTTRRLWHLQTYAALYNDMSTLAGAVVVDVPTERCSFTVSVEALGAAYEHSLLQGSVPRMLLLLHPSNPLGTALSQTQLHDIFHWALDHGLHVVVDEIYAFSVFDNSTPFVSAAKAAETVEHELSTTHIHILWGFSKDWCMSGFRTGILYSQNTQLIKVRIFILSIDLVERLGRSCVVLYMRCQP